MSFILLWSDEHDFERDIRRVADGLDEAVRRVHDFLDHRTAYDEEKAGAELYEDTLTPALQAFQEEFGGDDLAASLSGMRTGKSAKLTCEGGTFEIVRDR